MANAANAVARLANPVRYRKHKYIDMQSKVRLETTAKTNQQDPSTKAMIASSVYSPPRM